MKKAHHVVIDRTTGDVISTTELDPNRDIAEQFREAVHDCPECQAAIARGETPSFGDADQIAAVNLMVKRERQAALRRKLNRARRR